MSLIDWIIFLAAAIAGIWMMGTIIEMWMRDRGKDIWGDDDFSEMDPPS